MNATLLLTRSRDLLDRSRGIDFGATYLITLPALFFSEAGRFVSVDYWIGRWLDRKPW